MVGKFRSVRTVNGTCRLPFALNFSDCRAALDWILVTTWRASTKFKKLVNGKRISVPNVPTGKMGLPFQNFRLSREFSSGTNQKNVYYLHPNRNFREFVVNGKQRSLTRPHPIIAHDWSLPVALRVALIFMTDFGGPRTDSLLLENLWEHSIYKCAFQAKDGIPSLIWQTDLDSLHFVKGFLACLLQDICTCCISFKSTETHFSDMIRLS